MEACEVEIEITPGVKIWRSASIIRTATINLGLVQIPLCEIIESEDEGASIYPNHIRYGETVIDFDPFLVSSMAKELSTWSENYEID